MSAVNSSKKVTTQPTTSETAETPASREPVSQPNANVELPTTDLTGLPVKTQAPLPLSLTQRIYAASSSPIFVPGKAGKAIHKPGFELTKTALSTAAANKYSSRPIVAKRPLVLPESSTHPAPSQVLLDIPRPAAPLQEDSNIIIIEEKSTSVNSSSNKLSKRVKTMSHPTRLEPLTSMNKSIHELESAHQDDTEEAYSNAMQINSKSALPSVRPVLPAVTKPASIPSDPFGYIEYLRKHGAPNEFAYMVPDKRSKRDSTHINPYDLKMVDYTQLDRSGDEGYFSISLKGVTQFDANGNGVFTALDQWKREHHLFHSLLTIPFFHRYKTWKAFTLWRRTILNSKISEAKKALSKKLFFTNPVLCNALCRIRNLCYDMTVNQRLMSIKAEHSYGLDEFLQEQQHWVEGPAKAAIEQWRADIYQAANTASIACLQAKGFLPEDLNLTTASNASLLDTLMGELDGADQAESTDGSDKVRLSFTEQAARRNECRRLQRFVKLVDYMLVNALHMLAVDSVKDLLAVITKGLPDTDVYITSNGVAIPENGYIDGVYLETVSDDRGADFRNKITGGIQVGGAVVQHEVTTSTLLECNFEGFVDIMSRITKSKMPKLVELSDADDEREIQSALGSTISLRSSIKDVSFLEKDKSWTTESKAKSAVPLFRNELLMHSDHESKSYYFAPSLSSFLVCMETLVKSYLKSAESVPLIGNSIEYLDPAKLGGAYANTRSSDDIDFGDGPRTGSVIQEDVYYRELFGRLFGALIGIFANATTWMAGLEINRQMWLENTTFDFLSSLEADVGKVPVLLASIDHVAVNTETGGIGITQALISALEAAGLSTSGPILELAKTVRSTSGASSDDEDGNYDSPLANYFEAALGKFSYQSTAMNSIPLSQVINNMLIDTTKLKSILVPSPLKCFKAVSSGLPLIARDMNELLLNELQTWIRILTTPPSSVEGFVEYLEWFEKVKTSMTLVQQCSEEVSKLYVIMETHKIPIQPTDLAMFQTLPPTMRTVRETVDMASETKDDSISRFSIELEKMISALLAETAEIHHQSQDPLVLNPGASSDVALRFLDNLSIQLNKADSKKACYEQWSLLFKAGGLKSEIQVPPADLDAEPSELEQTKAEVELKRTLWNSLKNWDELTTQWKACPFADLNTENIINEINNFLKIVYVLDKGLPPNEVVPRLKKHVEEYRSMYTTVLDLRNPALKQRHWDRIQETVGKVFVRDNEFTLSALISYHVFDFKGEISNISAQAGSESALEDMLTRIIKIWNETEFILINYRDSKDVYIFGSVEDIQAALDDSLVTIATIKGSRFIGPIRTEVEKWDNALNLFAKTLESWLTCQRSWLYLESVFSAPDIQRQLPDEARMFSQVDRSWKETMRKVSRNPNALKSGTISGLFETMQQNNALLEQVQKCLEDYLESKRLLFPRFYFLSNDELLEILSQTKNPQAVQPHLSKCFDAIKSLEFLNNDAKSIEIVAMISPEGERVPFLKTIKARGNVEAWLSNIEEAMVLVLKRLTKVALTEFDDGKRGEWVREHVGQIVVTGNQVLWTKDVIECFKHSDPAKSLNWLRQKCSSNLSGLAMLVRGELTRLQRAIMGALITIDVHNRDIVLALMAAKVTGQSDFEWTKQMRYYWDTENDGCAVKMANSVFTYAYEYLGCSPRLVITPLTDRCYLTLTGAMQLNLGGSPVGPAGTGKTETVKDLAKALAKQCVVFNCSDGMDYKMMGKMFAGLAQSGAWCCFDEFNRIDIEVLSVIAQQLLTIKQAKDNKALKFIFEGREIRLIETCCAFITMNPGYAGRTELPDNLKALFRPIAMMIPDYGLISEIILYSEGFENAKVLSGKVVNLFKLCSEQLSQQDFYDFGMRAVKSVLLMAGGLKRNSLDLSEDVVLIRSLRDSNLPKFISDDVNLFKGILSDLFPGVGVPEKDYGNLISVVKELMNEQGLEYLDELSTRICQLYETMKIRHGVMLVGPTGGGKTTCYQLLRDATTRIKERSPSSSDFQKVKTWLLNPKCVAMAELYGEFDGATMEWKDGLIGNIFREQISDQSLDDKWTICDGPVDALWIENMNTVLDDNKLLTLINGERIKMNPTMHMLFEVADLAVASPATVSRCGMVYMDPIALGWKPFVQKWLRKLPETIPKSVREELWGYCCIYLDRTLHFIRKSCKEHIKSVDLNLVASLCKLIGTFLQQSGLIAEDQPSTSLKAVIGHVFTFSYIWSLGGNLTDECQDMFDTFCRDLFESIPIPDVIIPSNSSVFSYYIDFKQKTFSPWDDIVPAFKYNPAVPYFQMIVPTADTVKYVFLMENLVSFGNPVLLSGNTGVGKSIIAQMALQNLNKESSLLPLTMNFSAQTTSYQIQNLILAKLEKKRKNTIGAPNGYKSVALFVDDINIAKLDQYGSQPPVELIRQILDFSGFYDQDKLSWRGLEDLVLVAAAAPPGGGRNNVSPRTLRHFNILNVPSPTEMSLGLIFRSIVEGFLKPFSADVKSVSEAIVSSSIEIYHRMCTELLPTPAKSHYTFNLRDLCKVVQGILQCKPQVVSTRTDMAKLFAHEASRVFQDRLIDEQDRNYFTELLTALVESNFATSISKDAIRSIMYGDFTKRGVAPEDKLYAEISDFKAIGNALEEYLEEYNINMNKEVRLIFFMDAKQHISRISRILRQPRGNALLVGVGGTGKQSLTRLASYMADYKCYQVELTRAYGLPEWREDIKKLYVSAGQEGKHTVFLISDTQIKSEMFLEDVNSILNSGEIQNLFEFEEREKILGELRPLCREKGLPEDRDSVYQFFINRVRDHLHVVFATSPIGDAFRNRCRMFPSLVNCCTIDWFDEWPKEALLSVSKRFLEFVDLGGDEMRDKISEMCVHIHVSVGQMAQKFYQELRRRYYTTPTSYLELINLYVTMLHEKRKELGSSRDRLLNGLNKIAETNELVAKMQVELELLGPELKIRAADTEYLMVEIGHDQEKADEVRKVVAEEELIVREKAIATEAIATEAQKDLDEALPALEAAYNALDALEKKDIAELKVFTKPPELVSMVMEAICILFKMKPDWETSKKLLSDPQLMKKMQDFDKENIPDSTIKKLRKYIDNPVFTPDQVEKVSRACKSMSMWVIAMDIYSRVFAEVAPKRKKLEDAQNTLNVTRAKLAEKAAALAEVEAQLNKLKAKYEESVSNKKALVENMEETKNRLARAGKLTLALADEEIRWKESVVKIAASINSLVGNIFLSAASVAYFGAFTSSYRTKLVSGWIAHCQEIGIPVSSNFTLQDNFSDPAVIRDWNMQGLPSDSLSVENGILVTRGRRWPLMIDPQGQANRWIRNMEGPNLKVLKLNDPKLLRALENAVRTGQSVLLEDVGEVLDPAIEPLLLKQTIRQGGRLLMKLGDSLIEYDRNFKLYITSKLPNPHYLPEVCIKVTVINFTVTKEGLEGQLLGEVVKLERPELEEQRSSLIVNISADKRQLREIEEKILRLLFASSGNILDDEELIDTLNQSKITSTAIKERVEQAEITEQDINTAREKYRPVAIRGSVLYFCVADLADMDPMYQFSLKYFKNLFTSCIIKSAKPDSLEARINILCTNSTLDTFVNVSRGLFQSHKLIFAFMLCVETLKERRKIDLTEWNFFLRGGGNLLRNSKPKPEFSWLSETAWRNIMDLSCTITKFTYMADHFGANENAWHDFIESEDVFHAAVPGESEQRFSSFQKLILVKVLREELLISTAVAFIKDNLGAEFVASQPLDLLRVCQDMTSAIPLVFVLSSGSDPVSALVKYCGLPEVGMQDRINMISLGQGQGPIAEELLRRSIADGDWVFLQNCHLAASWMGKLENIVKELADSTTVNPSFRLFLSSMPSKVFPVSVLQESLKITNEPPKGLKANLARSFADVSRDLYEDHPPQGVKFKKLLFGLCFFNAVIHERKKFGPLGWNINYDWSNSDLEVSMSILKGILLDQPKVIAWEALHYLTGEITFGGRVTDEWDRRALKSILRKYYSPAILEDSYTFTDSREYYAPADSELSAVRYYIDNLPYSEPPSVFGMHENANISYQVQESKRLVKTVLDVQPRVSVGGSGKSSEDIVMDIASAILQEWPDPLDIDLSGNAPAVECDGDSSEISINMALFARDPSGRMINSLSTVLLQEVARFNKLNKIVKASLENLIRAIKGLVVMSLDLESVFNSILNNEIPHYWASNAYPSLKPLMSWIKDFQSRVSVLAGWARTGQPSAFWLPGFFFPQGFLTGVLQNHARKHNIPIDTLMFTYEVTNYASFEVFNFTKTAEDVAQDGVYIYGLYLEGARWDRNKRVLQDSYPMEMSNSVPVLRFVPTQMKPEYPDDEIYSCPLYKTSARAGTLSTTGQSTNFVVTLQIPSDRPSDYWISMGVALLCQLNE